jgi:hypothetical protein
MMQTIVPHGTDKSAPVGNSTLTSRGKLENSALVGNLSQGRLRLLPPRAQ